MSAFQQMLGDNAAVEEFATAMKAKLRLSREKGRSGWQNKQALSREDLSRMLREHVEKGDPVDVANFAMMLYLRGETIA